MKKVFSVAAAIMLAFTQQNIFADADLTVKYNGIALSFNEKPVIVNDKTLVQLRPIAEAMELEIGFSNGSVVLSDEETTVIFTQDSSEITVNDEVSFMDVPMVLRNDYTFVPVRNLVEPFGNKIDYDGETKTVTIESKIIEEATKSEDKSDKEAIKRPSENKSVTKKKETVDDDEVSREEENTEVKQKEPKEISTGSGDYESTYFYQSQPDLEFENNGRGYCWVCSYAMLFSNATKTVITPLDIAQYNIDKGFGGSFMGPHEELAKTFGLELVPALTDKSEYFAEFNTKNRGETTLNLTSDEDAKAAICEALDNFPCGVIVRYEGYPHSMIAVSYDEENIYFNDPGLKDGEHVTFENTCLKNFKLSDISYIQAVEVKE